ncbi:hypothetical protein D3C72_1956170 [compost metagenome]
MLLDAAYRVHRLLWRLEAALAVSEGGLDAPIGLQRIAFHGIEGLALGPRRNMGNDIPVAHETGHVHLRWQRDGAGVVAAAACAEQGHGQQREKWGDTHGGGLLQRGRNR